MKSLSKKTITFLFLITPLLFSCQSEVVKEDLSNSKSVNILFDDQMRNSVINISADLLEKELKQIIISENEFARGTYRVKNINNIGNNGVEVIYKTTDGQETNFIYFKDIDISDLSHYDSFTVIPI